MIILSKSRAISRAFSSAAPAVVGCGSNVVDVFFRVKAMPKAGMKGYFADPRKAVEDTVVGGVTLNHLGWAQVLGVPTALLALQGSDANGMLIRAAMEDLGVSAQYLQVSNSYTTSVSHIFSSTVDGERSIVMAPGSTLEIDGAIMEKFFGRAISSARIATTEISQVPLSGVIKLLDIAKTSSVLSMLDVDVPPSIATTEAGLGSMDQVKAAVSRANVLKPSLEAATELLAAFGSPLRGGESLDEVATRLLKTFGSQLVAVTDGGRGCGFATTWGAGSFPVIPIARVVDATGAGDAFFGGMVAGLYHFGLPKDTHSLQTLATLASAAGSANCMKLGALPDPATSGADVARMLPQVRVPIAKYDKKAVIAPPKSAFQQSVDADVQALTQLQSSISSQAVAIKSFVEAVLKGKRVFVTGVGKSALVAHRMAASLSSVSLPVEFVHAAEWIHGDLGKISGAGNVVVCISASGETPEIKAIVPHLQSRSVQVLGIVGRSDSTLHRASASAILTPVDPKTEPLGCPTRSISQQEAVVNAVLSEVISSTNTARITFKANHPGGAIGAEKL